MISSGWRCVLPGPTMNSDNGMVRSTTSPPSRRASVTSALDASNAGCESPAGDALTRLPPTVACSRSWSSANHTAARPSTGACSRNSGSCWKAAMVVAAPIRMRPCARLTPPSSASRLTSTSALRWTSPARPSRAQGSRSVAPATTRAPGTPAARAARPQASPASGTGRKSALAANPPDLDHRPGLFDHPLGVGQDHFGGFFGKQRAHFGAQDRTLLRIQQLQVEQESKIVPTCGVSISPPGIPKRGCRSP